MKLFYAYSKSVWFSVFFLFLLYQSSHNLNAQCSSCSDDLSEGTLISCDDFESYTANRALTSNSKWRGWVNASDFPNVQVLNGSKVINMSYEDIPNSNDDFDPDIIYRLGNKNSGRHRLSWDIFINTNKEGHFVISHDSQNSNGRENEAFSVDFKKSGKAFLSIGGKVKQDSFSYNPGSWNRIVNIIDIDQNRAELWINGQFIRTWAFNSGSLIPNKNLGILRFWTQGRSDYSYFIDNICYWQKNIFPCNGGITFDQVCVQNGANYLTSRGAACDLYTSKEYSQGSCERICDYARKFIDIDAPLQSGKLKHQALPLSVQQTSCVFDFFGYIAPKRIYGDVFAVKLRGGRYSIAWKTENGKKSKAFLFSCSCAGAICTQSCVPEDEFSLPYTAQTGEKVVFYNVEKAGYYYVAIISDEPIDYSNFNITFCPPNRLTDPALPELRTPTETSGCGPCQTLNPIVFTNDTTFVGSFTGEGNNFSESSEVYQDCRGKSARSYEGEDIVLKFSLSEPKIMTLSVNCSSPIGVFLYNYACGRGCLDIAESPDQGGTAAMAPILLQPGEHYIIIDKDTKFGVGATRFTLDLRFQGQSTPDFVNDDFNCPKETVNPHQVRIRSVGALLLNELSLTKDDRINFVYDKGQNNYQLAQGQYWNGQELVYNFFADKSGDPLKCSYATGDSFEVRIVNQGIIKYAKPRYNSGAEQVFKSGAQSVVNGFTQVSQNSFIVDTSPRRVSAVKGDILVIALVTSSSAKWTITNIPTWLKVEPTSGVGDSDITITALSDNPTNQFRKADLRFTNAEQYLRILSIEQKACTTASANLGPDIQVCVGDPLVLKPSGQGSFRWGNNSTASTLAVNTSIPGATSYLITASNGTCSARDTIKVTVNAKPVANAGVDQGICSGKSATLIASGGGTYKWSVNNATTASITVIPAATQSFMVTVTQGICSATDEVMVKVSPNPVIVEESIRPAAGPTGNIQVKVSSGTPAYQYKWFRNDTLVFTQEDLVGLKTAVYKLIVTDANGCTATYGPKLVTKSETISRLTELEVFPNPSSGDITIKGKLKAPEIIQVYILDATGRRIWKSEPDKLNAFEHNLDLQSLAKGIYMVQIKVSGYSTFKKIILL
jgi:trimeric autotransporter adhesin